MYSPAPAILLSALTAAYGQIAHKEPPVAPAPVSADDAGVPGPWISDLFYRGLANFSVRDAGSTACRRQTEMYERGLRNHTSWAVRMAESWDRRPIGILAGNRHHLGVYDECVNVKFPVRGQYCISEIKVATATGNDYTFNRTDDLDDFGINHAWKTVLGWVQYPDQIHRNILNIGVCIPDSCTAHDLQTSLQKDLDNAFFPEKIKAIVNVDPLLCTVSVDMYPYNTGYYVTVSLLVLLVLICCSVTIYHFIKLSFYKHNKNTDFELDTVSYVFSIISSGKDLLKFDKNNEFNYFNGFKVVVMLLVLLGHKSMYYMASPLNHSKNLEHFFLDGPKIIMSSMNLVDPFFYIAGYLTFSSIYPIYLKSGPFWLKLTSPLLYRIVRMLPAYCIMMAITAYVIPHFGDGPFWSQKTWQEAENCRNYWWANLLFISNFIDVKNQCMLISWYLSSDIQLFIVGIIILYICSKNKKYGIGILSILLLVSLCIPFIVTLLSKRSSIIIINLPFLENPRNSPSFSDSYRPSYMRAIPYLTGLAVGFLILKLKEKNVRFSQKTVFIGTFIMTVISVYAQIYGSIFYQKNRPYYPIEHALYATINHCNWPLLGLVICIFQFTSGYGILIKVFSNRLFVPLGRLSYCVFLVNIPVMLISQSTQRLPSHGSFEYLLKSTIHDIFKTYFVAILLHLFVEAPFGNTARLIFGRGPKKCSPENPIESPIKPTISLEPQNKEISHL